MAASLTGPRVGVNGQPGEVHTAAKVPVGSRAKGIDAYGGDAEYIYLKGITATIVGSVVTYEAITGVTALIVADMSGPVAVATAIVDANTKFGWYCIQGKVDTDVVANSAAAAAGAKNPGRETTDGKVGDGRAAGDEIANFFQLTATTAAAIVPCAIDHPYVNNFLGA